ncbi:hypothetical protein HMPREF3104_02190 [Corynebacterium sp. HMSC30G07]|uniref:hypothetical protein n=1 Tax=Corynebacterium sp. HMSC30G07 TaxID=1581072 RepID=UPI0008A2A2E1|nr:hypothetical protein [Corynebacterium sp. HMSC30G07]OFT77549.1 hypothetical protein HMPREF3104_02190 [Corynebacterium sp. HMSC30G07]
MTGRTGLALRSTRDMIAASATIPVSALRLLVRHLPQLIALICAGLAGRQAVIWLAVWLSNYSSFGASLIMPLAPLSVMMSLILCLWVLRPSLPFLAETFPERAETQSRARLLSVGGLLVSFLTVYATHGMLKEDLRDFRRATTIDEYMNQGFNADFSRAFVDSTAGLIALILGTIILRKIIGYFALAEKGLGLTYFSAYLEVLWMTTVSVFLTNQLSAVQDWALTRRSIAPTYRSYVELSENIEDSAGFLAESWAWLAAKLPAFSQLITVPIAWLTLGAVVFGTSLVAKQAAESTKPEATNTDTDAKASNPRLRQRMKQAARSEAKTVMDDALKPVAGPLKTTWKGLRTLARAGLVPMVIFCLVFMLATSVELGVVELGRLVAGPQQSLQSEQAATLILVFARMTYLMVVVCLVAAALDHFLRSTYLPSANSPKGSGSGSTNVT